jgi:hypothetical protein
MGRALQTGKADTRSPDRIAAAGSFAGRGWPGASANGPCGLVRKVERRRCDLARHADTEAFGTGNLGTAFILDEITAELTPCYPQRLTFGSRDRLASTDFITVPRCRSGMA